MVYETRDMGRIVPRARKPKSAKKDIVVTPAPTPEQLAAALAPVLRQLVRKEIAKALAERGVE